jgi:hypothetical protein
VTVFPDLVSAVEDFTKAQQDEQDWYRQTAMSDARLPVIYEIPDSPQISDTHPYQYQKTTIILHDTTL